MMINNRKRLESIKLKFYINQKCKLCKHNTVLGRMWTVYRWTINKEMRRDCYCQNCMHSENDVLNEIDTDESPFGIALVDSFIGYRKKDYTRFNMTKPKPIINKIRKV